MHFEKILKLFLSVCLSNLIMIFIREFKSKCNQICSVLLSNSEFYIIATSLTHPKTIKNIY